MNPKEQQRLLLDLQNAIQANVQEQQAEASKAELAQLAEITPADAIYQIDKISEMFVLEWFAANWPEDSPVELLMEGIEDGTAFFPVGTSSEKVKYTCILDPIDGTRCLMDDKRSAWVLTAMAPRSGDAKPTLRDINVAAMTELPPTKQRLADQIMAYEEMAKAALSPPATI